MQEIKKIFSEINYQNYYYSFFISVVLFFLFFVKNMIFEFNIIAIFLFLCGLILGNFFLIFDEYYHVQKLPTRSLIFMLSLLPMGIFLVTSTGSTLGIATFISLLWGLSLEIYLHKDNHDILKSRFLFQLKRELSDDEYKNFVWIWLGISMFFSILIFI